MRGPRMLALAVMVAGCAHGPPPRGPECADVRSAGSSQADRDLHLLLAPSIGLASPGDDVVRVVGPQMTCSGALIADDLVLTAHHCVVARGVRGEFTTSLVPPADVYVELGGDDLPWGNVSLKAILAPTCGEAGGRGDVALLVLARKLPGLSTLSLRAAPPRPGELVFSIGFGRCRLSSEGIHRRERAGGPITSVSPASPGTPGTFDLQASVCPGDSGGPVLDQTTRQIVGVVSLSALDYDEATSARSVFARIDGIPKLLAYGRLVADGVDPADLPPLSCE